MLAEIPSEITEAILDHIPEKQYLLALSSVSKSFRVRISPRIFDTLKIQALKGPRLWSFKTHPVFDEQHSLKDRAFLRSIKSLTFEAPPVHAPRQNIVNEIQRCYHPLDLSREVPYEIDEQGAIVSASTDEAIDGHDDDASRRLLQTTILPALAAVPAVTLTSFNWRMGGCLPKSILGKNGFLVQTQPNLRHVSLIYDIDCKPCAPDLTGFIKLHSLYWHGIANREARTSLKEVLQLRHEQLINLDLDFVHWMTVKFRADCDALGDFMGEASVNTRFVDFILGEYPLPDGNESFLPKLRRLSLTAASLLSGGGLSIDFLPICRVKYLRLIRCVGTIEMLDHFVRTGGRILAEEVELVFAKPIIPALKSTFVDFIKPFHGLRDLFILFESDFKDDPYIDTILEHKSTLRRLVYHRRHLIRDDQHDESYYCDTCLSGSSLNRTLSLFNEMNLKCVGLCDRSDSLKMALETIDLSRSQLQLFHLRSTGYMKRQPAFDEASFPVQYSSTTAAPTGDPESEIKTRTLPQIWPTGAYQGTHPVITNEERYVKQFAQWAFGPSGFPKLQVLATGDFSHSHGNFGASEPVLWCRDTTAEADGQSFRKLTPSDFDANELVEANMDLLKACAVSPLIHRYGQPDQFPGPS